MGNNTVRIIECFYRCTLHTDRSDPLSSDALVFHAHDDQVPPPVRRSEQVYVIYGRESPIRSGDQYIKGSHFYNWSATYDPRSDIYTPYVDFVKKSFPMKMPLIPQLKYKRSLGEAMIFWMVSSCYAKSKRERYVKRLKRHISIDIYGKCGMPCPSKQCFRMLARSGKYKFYLSFENSLCKSYVTEKLLNPLKYGLIPIVYGGFDVDDYSYKLPSHSYLDVRNFDSPRQLSKYIFYLDQNNTAYLSFFEWKKQYVVRSGSHDILCGICNALHNSSMIKPRNVNWKRFWNPNYCNNLTIDQVTG